jgi:ectoine hydroxylase-related dioxygenase (phytanoyl-CoA dioxygenase family)
MDARQRFAHDGFYIHRESVLGQGMLERAVQGVLDVRDGVYDTGVAPLGRNWNPGEDMDRLIKLDNAHMANTAIMDVLLRSGVGELASQVTGAESVQVWALQALYKPPTVGKTNASNVGWHQDQTLWAAMWEEGSELFTAWLALSDVTAESGAMEFVRGSHTWGPVGGSYFEQDQDLNRASMAVPDGAEWDAVTDVLPPGGVSFHHRSMVHGSNQNVSSGPRISLAIHLRTEKSRLRPNEEFHLHEHLERPEVAPVIYRRS